MGTETILTRYAAGERSFPRINLQEAELIKVNLSNIGIWQTFVIFTVISGSN